MRSKARKNTAVALAAAAALSISLTACNSDGGDGDGDDSKASGSSSSVGTSDSSDSAKNTSGGTVGGSSVGGEAAPAGADDCTLATSKIAMQETGGSAPVVLLKITNNGDKRCSVFGAPFISDPTAGKNLPVAEDTRPQSVVSVEPNQSAYAAIGLAAKESGDTHRTKTFNVTLATKDGKGTDGHASVGSPGPAGLLLDSSSQVTYWQSTSEDALT
ncbi:DUF4232 domain-containing protein [Streptomyces sp. NBC_01381]|uniref:DUF4232 domain-containing protein n=1 Tax=Streptomyces sp. NBC_01381 TaxID=2903845 RepID=UPI002251D845|nr:DUF4232 domain-containing protein [Streptomyces sp. NBC_01381]MCX4665697.1 DUF4232 domain-containing protein [Streptomyces sp. NBC_01381]